MLLNAINNCYFSLFYTRTVGQARNLNFVRFPSRPFSIGNFYRNKQEEQSVEESVSDNKNRVEIIPVETSIRYLKSSAYAKTYGDEPVWKQYRRNHKGAFAPLKTRKTCIRSGKISTGNPCPICRDEYLVLHPENVELLKQFISPHTGEILNAFVTGICQNRYKELLIAIEVARDRGLITFDVPFRTYDY